MSLILYHCATSYASIKARLYLAEKGLPFISHHIDLRQQEQISSDYRLINPKGTVPAMQLEGGRVVCDSTPIMLYCEARWPTPPLFPDAPGEKKACVDFCYAHEALHDPHLRTLSYALLFMKGLDKARLKRIMTLAKKHPNPERGAFLLQAAKGELPHSAIKAAKQAVHDTLVAAQDQLTSTAGPFLWGEHYSAADAVCTATVFRCKALNSVDTMDADSPLMRWYTRMQHRTSFSCAITDWISPTTT